MQINRVILAGLWVLCTFAALALGGNTHQSTGDIALEQRAWWGDTLAGGYIVQGCLPGTSATTSVTIATCRAYTLATTPIRQLEYVEDLTSQVVSFTAGNGTYWLIVHASTTDTVAGWTRASLSHYLWQLNSSRPTLPNRATLLAQITVSGAAVTTVLDWRTSNPYQPNIFRVTDPLWGARPYDTVNDAPAIQAAFTAATRGNVTIEFPPGQYLVDGDNLLAIQGVWGTSTSIALHNVRDVHVQGYGAKLLQGASSVRLFGVYASEHVTIRGLALIGHTQNINEQKHGIVVGHNSRHVDIADVYITNFLGDTIYIGGNLSSGAETGYTSEYVRIHHSTLKERYGNGISSVSGGTRSRLAIASPDVRYLTVENNTIIGGVDLEPDVNNQYIYHVKIRDNTFSSGPVTPQSTIGTTYLHDEPIVTPGTGTLIDGSISLTGVPAAPVIAQVEFLHNAFDRGVITCVVDPYRCTIIGNTFRQGLIQLSGSSGVALVENIRVEQNSTESAYPAQTTFIKLNGQIIRSRLAYNRAIIPGGYVIDDTGGSSGDGGRNVFVGNVNESATAAGAIGFIPLDTSAVGQQYFDQAQAADHLTSQREVFTSSIVLAPRTSPPTLAGQGEMYTDTSNALCWFDGNTWTKIAGPGTCS